MKVIFEYNKEKDIWCLLNKGGASNNSQAPTRQYAQLVAEHGENPTPEATTAFIEKYLADNKINPQELIQKYQNDWDTVSEEYHKRASAIFGTTLPNDITGYLTINSRCPYSIRDNYFYVSTDPKSVKETAMHELWHFYTWYGLGEDQEEKLGKQRYNDLKESLTVLLNVECNDLLSGAIDYGYPQHKAMRAEILHQWSKDRSIARLWKLLTQ